MMTEPISLWVSHEAISRFFEKGLSIPEVALISGHKDVRMLFRYTHLKAEDILRKLWFMNSELKNLIEIVNLLAKIVLVGSVFYFIFFTKTSAIDFLTTPLILASLLIALSLSLILKWAKRVNKKKLWRLLND